MKRILAMIASPRKLGNSEIMAKEISRNIDAPHELQLLRLSDFDIRECRACYMCLMKDRCVIDDDHARIAAALVASDALILIAPTYFLGPNANLKRFVDRGLSLYAHTEALWGKPAVGVGIAGIPGKEGYTLLGIESALKVMMTDMRAARMIYGALPGEIFLNDENRQVAREMAALLTGGTTPKEEGPRCNQCGGQTFRFLGGDRIQCMLCSNYGTVAMTAKGPAFSVDRSEHEFFLTKADARKHKEWLIGMKSRFMANKDALKKISLDYRNGGEWITPVEKPAKDEPSA